MVFVGSFWAKSSRRGDCVCEQEAAELQHVHELPGGLGNGQIFIVRDDNLSGGQGFFQMQDIELRFLLRDTEVGDECDSQADACKVNE